MFIITHIDKFFHNSPSTVRCLGTPHFIVTRIPLPLCKLLLLDMLNLFIQRQHPGVKFRHHLGTLNQFFPDVFRRVTLKFVVNLMLQARPKIHGNCSDLNLYFRILNAVRQIHRYAHQHVIALIAAGFRIHDIVFHGNHFNIPLITDHLCNLIDVRCKGTDHTNPRYIIDIANHIVDGRFIAVFL